MPVHLVSSAKLCQTRSKRVFSPYEGEPLVVPDPQFDFLALVKQCVQEEDCLAELDAYNPFDSQSHLSTPPSTPLASPTCSQIVENSIPALDLDPPSTANDSLRKHSNRSLNTKPLTPHTSTSYVGLREETWKCMHMLEELVGPRYGFTHYRWSGSVATPITDRDGTVIAVLAGHPDDPNWDKVHEEAADRLETMH
ncbi:hypothetical protein ARMSODRAFT_1023786 [Armillaria solidipes]|uniref:Uncharacterized protein n=1 Tax=Armillaria solidipes TaxID=1076256 RepID=A0A2H3AY51_9AGAR|nr:hypothetical protein ARMSODRAFT_1023786 [Armillaria solidipes]